MAVLLDIVPNHVSSQHPWFISAKEGGDGHEAESGSSSGRARKKWGNPAKRLEAFLADQHGPNSPPRKADLNVGTCTCSMSANQT